MLGKTILRTSLSSFVVGRCVVGVIVTSECLCVGHVTIDFISTVHAQQVQVIGRIEHPFVLLRGAFEYALVGSNARKLAELPCIRVLRKADAQKGIADTLLEAFRLE